MYFISPGTYVGGSHVELSYEFTGLFKIPCRFDLRKYPFGNQKCEMYIWVNTQEDFDYANYSKAARTKMKARFDVGEYMVKEIITKSMGDNNSILLSIQLKSKYSYHLLTSYLTSFLILLISYGTFFFHVNEFNERIMVSLTSLLVLTGLFSQSNSSSIETPYLKLLDVWYASLIIFTFMVVLVNIILNKMQHDFAIRMEAKHRENSTKYNLEKFRKYNLVAGSIIAVMLVSFLILYILSAADAI